MPHSRDRRSRPPPVETRTRGRRRPAVRRVRGRRRGGGIATPLLRLAGACLFLTVLTTYLAPLRDVARHATAAVRDATNAGRRAAVREALVIRYALRYAISIELADAIERAAAAEGIDPDLAFRLVYVESRFRPRAVSSAGALGLTQLMPATANDLQPGITREEIFDRDINLRLGFRYLRWLLRVYDGDVTEALHAYNRGPGTVARIRAQGGDPANGYADKVLKPEPFQPRPFPFDLHPARTVPAAR